MKFTLPPGQLFSKIQGNCLACIGNLTDAKNWVITITEEKDQRSIAQNSTLFGVYYPPLMEYMGLAGERDRQDLHEYWCGEYWGWSVTEIMGKKKHRPQRTTTTNEEGKRDVISTSKFNEFCEFIKREAADHGCFIPDPDPMHHIKEREDPEFSNVSARGRESAMGQD